MKIALFHNLPSGGAKRHTYEQVKELSIRGHQIVEFAPSTSDLEFCNLKPYVSKQVIFPANSIQLPSYRIPFITPYLHSIFLSMQLNDTKYINKKIANQINNGDFDIALIKDCQFIGDPYILRFLEIPNIYQCHHGLQFQNQFKHNYIQKTPATFLQNIKNTYYKPAKFIFKTKFLQDEKKNIKSAQKVITNSNYIKKLILTTYNIHSTVIYPGINTAVFKPLRLNKSNFVLTVGALIANKGHRFLVEALARIDKSNRPELVIAANMIDVIEQKEVLHLSNRLGVTLRIEQIRNSHEMAAIYNQALVFVYAPYREPLGMAPLEAMACGTPVIAVAEGGLLETIKNNQTGFLVPRNLTEFAKILQFLLKNPDIRTQMGEAGIKYVHDSWSWGRAVDNLESELYKSIK